VAITIHKSVSPSRQEWEYDNPAYAVPTVAEVVTTADAKLQSWSVTGGGTAGTFTITDGAENGFTVSVDVNELVEGRVPRFMAGGFSIVASVAGMKLAATWR
jgi:pseudouridine-5'-phosphate glycosidase